MIRANLPADAHGRGLRDSWVGIVDRCNFGCLHRLPETAGPITSA